MLTSSPPVAQQLRVATTGMHCGTSFVYNAKHTHLITGTDFVLLFLLLLVVLLFAVVAVTVVVSELTQRDRQRQRDKERQRQKVR